MITKVTYGIEANGLIYGWINKELYRLPVAKGRRSYGLKKMRSCIIGNKVGYYINRKKRTIDQLLEMTTIINREIHRVRHGDIPF